MTSAAHTKGTNQMKIADMIAIAQNAATANGESRDSYWGEYPSVMKLLTAYYGGLNTASDMRNYNRLRS